MGYGVCHEMCCNGLGFTLYKLADGLQIGKKNISIFGREDFSC